MRTDRPTGECKECGGGLPADRHYTHYCTQACYKRHLRRDTEYGERDRVLSRAWKDRNREANRARDREFIRQPEMRGTCVECGELRGAGSGRRGEGSCASCRHKRALARDQQIVDLYNAGVSFARMAAELGVVMGSVARDADRLRKQGRIGYRYAGCAAKQAA